ncbi:AMP-binding protein [Halioxenophilus sp. WMMB6]|uniref:AMP-binding protein n=1 Tax=Halioxenophilus sp. WMMB6 TaxID=3073815 RepID=UPI00295E67D1|nr:AMP-binding protein [Halioxenophilus sp. WMMB6]
MLLDAVATFALRTPQALACVDLESDRRWNYHQFDRDINRLANFLVARLGAASCKRVASIARNRAELIMLYLACARAGAIYVPCNWRLAEKEIELILEDAEPELIVCDAEFRPSDTRITAIATDDLLTLAKKYSEVLSAESRRPPEETTLLLYTSGTSGLPKGVKISELNAFWSQQAFNSGNEVGADSIFLCDMPLFHTAGLLANTRAPLQAGGAVLISRGFDEANTFAHLSDSKLPVSHYFSVPQMARRLWDYAGFDPEKLRHLRVYATGGAPNPQSLIERFIDAGVPMSNGFGMTETGSVSGMPLHNLPHIFQKCGCAGAPYFGVELRVTDERGKALPVDNIGELWVRGPGVTSGYWNQPEKTELAFAYDWFKTGDMARLDQDGYLFIVDRKKDMFISGGENIYSAELEAVITELNGVAEVAVIGLPDAQWGEIGVAAIVAKPGVNLAGQEVERHCRARLAAYKVPKKILLVKQLPYTSSGKIQKHLLRDMLAQSVHGSLN